MSINKVFFPLKEITDNLNIKVLNILILISNYKKKLIMHIFNFFLSLIILFIGISLSNFLSELVIKILRIKKIDETLVTFLHTLLKYAIIVLTLVITLNILGIKTSSILTVIGAAGLAVGLALQGSLSNLASGILLVGFRHFKVKDFVDLSGISGIVISVQLFSTTLKTLDGRIVIVPNNRILLGNIINYSTEPNKLIDVVISVERNSNISYVKKCILMRLKNEKFIIRRYSPIIQIVSISPSSIDFSIRVWVKRENIRIAVSNIYEIINNEFKKKGIIPPCPKNRFIIIKE